MHPAGEKGIMNGEVLDMAVITYLGHSGFAVRTGSHLLIFDLSLIHI